MKPQKHYLFFAKIILLTLIISAIPLPKIVLEASPFWMLLSYTYWLTYSNHKNIGLVSLILGLLIDILQGSILGQNSLALIISSAFISKIKQSFINSNLSTQQVYIFGASSIYLALILLVHILIQGFDISWYLLLSPLISALFWPLVKWILTKPKQ